MTNNLEVLKDALNQRRAVSFSYDEKPKLVEVHAIGHSTKDGGTIMRGWQVAGESSRPVPCWGLYRVDNIDSLMVTSVESRAPREGYAMNDRQMNPVIAQVELADASV